MKEKTPVRERRKPVKKTSSERGQIGTPRCENIFEYKDLYGSKTIKQRCRKKAKVAGLCKTCDRFIEERAP